MTLLNFAHPLTIEGTTQTITITTQFDHERPFADQAKALIDSINLTSEEWQTTPLLLNLPSLAPIAAVVLAEIHGRCGYFPSVVRMKPVAGAVPPRFEVAEVIGLQEVRDGARERR